MTIFSNAIEELANRNWLRHRIDALSVRLICGATLRRAWEEEFDSLDPDTAEERTRLLLDLHWKVEFYYEDLWDSSFFHDQPGAADYLRNRMFVYCGMSSEPASQPLPMSGSPYSRRGLVGRV